MPHSALHAKKLGKNLALAGLVLLWCALIWAVTMIKIARADDGRFDARNTAHLIKTEERKAGWDEAHAAAAPVRLEREEATAQHHAAWLNHNLAAQDGWDARYAAAAPARQETEERAAQARTTHLNATSARTEGWDARWAARQQAAMTP